MTIEKDAEDIIEKFSKILEDIPDSDEKVFLGDAYNYTLYDSLAAGIVYNQKKSKTKKKNNNKIDEYSPTL